MHIMIDLETLDTVSTSVILSIGAVSFDDHGPTGSPLELFLSVDDQLAQGRTISQSTLLWWLGQSQENREQQIKAERLCISSALIALTKWVLNVKDLEGVWGNGSDFDNAILQHLYQDNCSKVPWKYYQNRDLRTLREFCGGQIDMPPNEGAHSAKADALWQAKYAAKIIRSVF